MDSRYVIIADDLTGANDTGIQFLKAGYSSSVVLDSGALRDLGAGEAAVLDTESRNIPEREAAAVLEKALPHLAPLKGKGIFFKKVDSTLRGNIRAETAVLRNGLEFSLTVFAPSYPGNRRTAVNGVLLLDGVPVAETEMARDPRKPALTSSLAECLQGREAAEVRTVSLDEIRGGMVPAILESSGFRGTFCFDGETEADLGLIAGGVLASVPAEEVLWVGSAGLAGALVSAPRPVLLVVASLSPGSAFQARHVIDRGLAAPVHADIGELLTDGPAEAERLAREAAALLRRGRNVLLASSLEERQVEAGRNADAGERISAVLADAVSRILAACGAGGVFVTGGEAAIHVVRALGGRGVSLVGEVEPGIPLVRLIGGPLEGLPLITKAGGFGAPETMERCIGVLSAFRGKKNSKSEVTAGS